MVECHFYNGLDGNRMRHFRAASSGEPSMMPRCAALSPSLYSC